MCRPIGKPAVENLQDFCFGDVFLKQARNAGAFAVAAGVQVVAPQRFAHQADFGQHGAAAAVGAAGDAQHDVFFCKAVFGKQGIDFVGKLRQKALGFGHGQGAGGVGHAGHRVFTLWGNGIADEAVGAGDLLDFAFLCFRHVGDNQVLVGGEAEIALVHLGDFAHAGFERAAGIIEDAAVFDKKGEVPAAVFALHPADAVAARGELIGADGLKFGAHAIFHFFDKGFCAHALEGVACFGGFAVAAVAPVALHGNHGGGAIEHFIQPDKAEFARGVGVGGVVAVLHREAAAHQHVEAGEAAVFFNRHKIQIVGVQIHIVVRRNHHGGFEFARQIVFAEHRLGGVAAFYAFFQRGGFGELLGGMQLFAIEPDFGVGQRFGQQMLADFFRPLISFAVQRRFHRIAGAQHIAVDIAGGGDGIEP